MTNEGMLGYLMDVASDWGVPDGGDIWNVHGAVVNTNNGRTIGQVTLVDPSTGKRRVYTVTVAESPA